MQSHPHLAQGRYRALAAALLLALTGCAGTLTVAIGEDARAAVAQPQCGSPLPSSAANSNEAAPALSKTTKHTVYDDKVGLKPQIESVTETVEAVPTPPPEPLHESVGGKFSEKAGSFLLGAGKMLLCLGTLGGVCL